MENQWPTAKPYKTLMVKAETKELTKANKTSLEQGSRNTTTIKLLPRSPVTSLLKIQWKPMISKTKFYLQQVFTEHPPYTRHLCSL